MRALKYSVHCKPFFFRTSTSRRPGRGHRVDADLHHHVDALAAAKEGVCMGHVRDGAEVGWVDKVERVVVLPGALRDHGADAFLVHGPAVAPEHVVLNVGRQVIREVVDAPHKPSRHAQLR
jgi:hypothetical protein